MSLLATVHGYGTTAAKPAASPDNEGYIYFDTDLDKLQRSNGTSWDDIERADPAAGSTAFVGARVYRTTSQTLTSGAVTALSCDAERYDTDGFHEGVTNPTRLTVPTGKAGYYSIGGCVLIASNGTGSRLLRIRLNGTTDIVSQQFASPSVARQYHVNTQYQLAEADYVELMVTQDSGGNLDVQVGANFSPEFWMALLGV